MRYLEKRVDALMRLCVADRETDREQVRQELRKLMEYDRLGRFDPEQEIRRILLELGAPDHLVGHDYVVQGILLVIQDRMYINNITFGLYPQLAVMFDTTPARVERAIRHLIEVTWARGDFETTQRYFGNIVSASKGKPTNGEFIARIANEIRQRIKILTFRVGVSIAKFAGGKDLTQGGWIVQQMKMLHFQNHINADKFRRIHIRNIFLVVGTKTVNVAAVGGAQRLIPLLHQYFTVFFSVNTN